MSQLSLIVHCVLNDFPVWPGEAFPQVDPDRQQHFERSTFHVSCEGLDGLTGWKMMRKVKGQVKPCAATWESATAHCRITNAYKVDSGEYWCETGRVKRSSSVNITVTGTKTGKQ